MVTFITQKFTYEVAGVEAPLVDEELSVIIVEGLEEF